MASARNQVIAFKVTAEELEAIKRGAEKENFTLSEYCRVCLLRDRFTDNDLEMVKGFVESLFSAFAEYLKIDSPEPGKRRLAADLLDRKFQEKMQRAPHPDFDPAKLEAKTNPEEKEQTLEQFLEERQKSMTPPGGEKPSEANDVTKENRGK